MVIRGLNTDKLQMVGKVSVNKLNTDSVFNLITDICIYDLITVICIYLN